MDYDAKVRTFVGMNEGSELLFNPLERRLWSKVQIVDDENSCWEWQRSRRPVEGEDYGNFKWTPPGRSKSLATNPARVVLFLATGALPRVACHRCDNPPCCRPKHLYDGTHKTNGIDKAMRGRGRTTPRPGEAHHMAVLTDAKVIEARQRARRGEGVSSIGRSFGVDGHVIHFAMSGKTWAHLNDIEPPVALADRKGRGKLTNRQIAEIIASGGQPVEEVATQFGITTATVYYHWRRHDVATPLRNRRT